MTWINQIGGWHDPNLVLNMIELHVMFFFAWQAVLERGLRQFKS